MKKILIVVVFYSSVLFYSCTDIKIETPPQQNIQSVNPGKTSTINIASKILGPLPGKPDLKVFPFFQNGNITIVSLFYKIPLSFKEQNIGTADDLGAYADTLKVYQKIPFLTTYSYRFVGNFLRTSNIPIGGTYFLNSNVMFPIAWRPATGKINLVIKADGGNTIYELDESNNLSPTIWNITLP